MRKIKGKIIGDLILVSFDFDFHRGLGVMFREEEINDFAVGRNILLMEDNEINAQIAEAQLKPAGFNVVWAENGREGVDIYLDSDPSFFCCVITDIMMPEIDGYEAAKMIRESGRNDAGLPILGITANVFSAESESVKNKDLNQFITKPYKRTALLEWIYVNVNKYEGIDVTNN